MTIYRKVLCSERLPEKSSWYYTQKGMLYFDLIQGSFYESSQFVGENEYWLEEIELPSEEDIIGMGHYYEALESEGDSLYDAYKQGANYILNKLK